MPVGRRKVWLHQRLKLGLWQPRRELLLALLLHAFTAPACAQFSGSGNSWSGSGSSADGSGKDGGLVDFGSGSGGDGGDYFGLHPYSDEELLNEMLQNTVDVMSLSNDHRPPSFAIVQPRQFLSSEQSVNSHTLPTNFLLSLSYKPLNNTVLSLFSLMSHPAQSQHQPNRTTTQSNSSHSIANFSKIHSEFRLSHSATVVVHSDRYYDLSTDFSASYQSRYSLNLIVMNGRVGMCLNGEYHPPIEGISLWNDVKTTDTLEMKFSPYLRSVSSLGIICSMKLLPLPEDLPSSPFLCSLIFHTCVTQVVGPPPSADPTDPTLSGLPQAPIPYDPYYYPFTNPYYNPYDPYQTWPDPQCTGPPGHPGPQGPRGHPGPAGRPGRHGFPGEKGPRGRPGPFGLDGMAGGKGVSGYTGPPGHPGLPGNDGRKGEEGEQGPRGHMGASSRQGPQGLPGARGPPGHKGVKGARGMKGRQSDRGPNGYPVIFKS
jgi:hypothetical protein